MEGIIDLRSDTVTRPSAAMRRAMAEAEVGDDVYAEDPTVNRLERLAAELSGMEAALFVTSGTQGNLLALLSHCGRGDEYIAGQTAHCYRWEGGGGAVFGGIQPQPLEFEADGTLDPERIEAAIKPDDCHYARTRLVCLENTQAGKVLPLDYFPRMRALADRHRLRVHLDGARLFNATVKLGVTIDAITRHLDTVNICLSKGLGAPVGSVLCGDREVIAAARRWRKVAGGGMRQAGILAAAGIFALERNVVRLADDHAHARLLAEGLAGIDELEVDPARVQTNMLFATVVKGDPAELERYLKEQGIIIRAGRTLRLVTHLDVTEEGIGKTVREFKTFFSR